jgi:hypothetical protein
MPCGNAQVINAGRYATASQEEEISHKHGSVAKDPVMLIEDIF